jgi:single-strand selective monofunctional uracil DNA glycosylase
MTRKPTPVDIAKTLRQELAPLSPLWQPPVTHVYNPLEYAWAPFRAYCERFGQGSRRVLLLGMNPGPWGMAQTGVPFGEVSLVREWLGIEEKVGRPEPEHPKRPVHGFACKRREVSGARLWGFARERFGTPERFFRDFLVLNYCPLAFIEVSGKNRTPDKLPPEARAPLFAACDRALRAQVAYHQPEFVVGVGAFAEGRARAALGDTDVKIGRISHPSPASPVANAGWADRVVAELLALGIAV